MKKIIIALFAFVSISAFAAAPKVGDTATYALDITGMGTGTSTTTITAFDAATQTYTVKTDTSLNGQSQSEEEVTPAADMASEEMIAQILSNCAPYGGTSETVTVPAGTFAVCTINGASIGQVPFGFVKVVQTENGVTIHGELVSAARGN